MAIRVDREIFDAIGVGSESSGLRVYEDGTRQAPWEAPPFASSTERAVSDALRLMAIPADVIRQQLPPQSLGGPFPPMFGYNRVPLTIDDVLDTDRWSPRRRSWTSGVAETPRRLDTGDDMWSGTLRGYNPASPDVGSG